MTDRQVKRSTDRNSGAEKSTPFSTPTSGRTSQRGNQPPSGPISVDSISLLSTGALGALINGLEDEFHGKPSISRKKLIFFKFINIIIWPDH